MAGYGQEAIFERSCIEHQGVVLLPGASNELVHDAAACPNESVLRALAGKRNGGQWERSTRELEQSERGSDLDRGGRTEAGPQRNIAFNRKFKTADRHTFLGHAPGNSHGVIAPVFSGDG